MRTRSPLKSCRSIVKRQRLIVTSLFAHVLLGCVASQTMEGVVGPDSRTNEGGATEETCERSCDGHGDCVLGGNGPTCACHVGYELVAGSCLPVGAPRTLTLSGAGVLIRSGDYAPSPRDLTDLGGVRLGERKKAVFTLRNVSGGPLRVGEPSVEAGLGFRVESFAPTTLAPGAEAGLTVEFEASRPGASTAELRVPFEGEGSPYRIRLLASATYFPSYADPSTTALWLFDERQYGYTTLTDASRNELDLLAMGEARLVSGKFGSALEMRPGSDFHVSYPGWQADMVNEHMRGPDGTPSGLWPPTEEPRPLLDTLMGREWTLELWLSSRAPPSRRAAVLDLGDAFAPGFSIAFEPAAPELTLDVAHHYAGKGFRVAVDPAVLFDGGWHHLALVFHADALRLFVDGKPVGSLAPRTLAVAPLPPSSTPADRSKDTRGFTKDSPDVWKRERRFNLALGEERDGQSDLDASLDELRVSSVARYDDAGPPPGSFSRVHGPTPPPASKPTAPPLLFPGNSASGTVQLGSRKHVFLDGVLLQTLGGGVSLRQHPVGPGEELTLSTAAGVSPIEPPGSTWRETVYDENGKVYLFIADGYSSAAGLTRVYVSEDGVRFAELPIVDEQGRASQSIVLRDRPHGAVVFKDENPASLPEERFKLTSFASNRGTVLYVSPDGLHWRRNESQMLPLMSGGDAETFFDDQLGEYVTHIKRDSGSRGGNILYRGRRAVQFRTKELFRPWPMKELVAPYFEGYPIPTITDEGPATLEPVVRIPALEEYDVFRTRAQKYPWAPDAYVGFVWLGYQNYIQQDDPENKRRRTRLATSRDGVTWRYVDGWYMDSVATIDGAPTREAISIMGMIRRGDELWQYVEYSTENNGDGKRRYHRVKQRLDGFMSLYANDRSIAITRPFTFEGSKLTLNVQARGRLRVGLRDENGLPIAGFSTERCDGIAGLDSLAHVVTWGGNGNLAALAGQPIRLELDLQDTDLYAIQFVK